MRRERHFPLRRARDFPLRRARHFLRLSTALLLLAGCSEEPPPRREPPPPAASAKPSACSGASRANDPGNLEHMPAKVAGFCLDPSGSDKDYGEGAKNPLEGIFDVFDGEGEIYRRFQVKRVVQVRYVDGAGSGAT